MLTIEYNGSEAKITGLNAGQLKSINKVLTFYDPSKSYLAKKSRHISSYVSAFNQNKASFPTGLLYRVAEYLVSANIPYRIKKNVEPVHPVEVDLPDWLYDHQIKIIKTAIQYRRMAAKSPTGSGKTIAATYYLAHFPEAPCLFVVPTIRLMHQTAKTLQEHLKEEVGLVGDGKKDYKRVTVGVIDSLTKDAKSLHPSLKKTQVMVIDEDHRSSSKKYQNLSKYCTNTDFRLSLTATVKPNLFIEGMSGPRIVEIPPSVMVNLGIIFKPSYYVIDFKHDPDEIFPKCLVSPSGFPVRDAYGQPVYKTEDGKPFVIDVQQQGIARNQARNELIIEALEVFLKSKHRTGPALILVEYLEHAELLQQIALERLGIDVPFCSGKTKNSEELISKLSNNELDVMISTRVLNEGTDIVPIELAIIANGGASDRKIIQQTGRALRLSSDTKKTRALVFDFSDEGAAFYLSSQAHRRRESISSEYPGCIKHVTLSELKDLV